MQPAPENPDKPASDAKRRGKRIIAGVFVALTSVFIGLSALQIIPQVFGVGVPPIARASASGPPSPACAAGVSSLAAALDRGLAASTAVTTADEEAAVAAFHTGLSPEWDAEADVARRCGDTARGQDAFAALLRLRLADEHFVRKNVVEIAPLRRNVAAYLSH